MPEVTVEENVDIYYEVHGEGEPLLLIMGLSHNALSWHRTIPVLSEHYKVIAFDNRGVGRSSKPESAYSIELMARDAKAVLDAANVESAHIYGISMGGMIAQRFSLLFPKQTRSLILGCTTAGGETHIPPAEEILAQMATRYNTTSTPEEIAWSVAPIIYSDSFLKEQKDIIAADIEKRIKYPTPAHAYLRQLEACMSHNTAEEVSKLNVPTLVIHGDADALVPYENGKFLAENINNAEFLTIPGAGHIYISEAQGMDHERILQFLKSVS